MTNDANRAKKLLTAESTDVDFKVSLEKVKPKSWLKTVVAFSNGIGGSILFGVDDDRLEIVSPGGMYDGKNIQEVDINRIASIRRNSILADIFNRLDYMERRGSGLKRIKESFDDESRVEFFSNQSNFFVVMKKQMVNASDDFDNERLTSD